MFDQTISTILTKMYSQFDQNLYTIWPNFGTGGVEVWSKFGRHFDQTSALGVSKFGRHFGQTSALGVSKFGRSLASKFGRHLIEHLNFTMWFIHISIKLRTNFDIGGVGVWSKFGRRFYQNSTKFRHWCQSLGEVSTKFRNQKIYTILLDQHTITTLTQQISQFWSKYILNFDPTIYIMLINIYSQFWPTYIHKFENTMYINLSRQYLNAWP